MVNWIKFYKCIGVVAVVWVFIFRTLKGKNLISFPVKLLLFFLIVECLVVLLGTIDLYNFFETFSLTFYDFKAEDFEKPTYSVLQ